MRLSDVQHQPLAHERIQLAIASGRVPHAYLFSGLPGVGREMMAQRLGQLLLCRSPIETAPPGDASGRPDRWREACGKCEECGLFQAGNHPDYHRIYRTLNKHHPDKAIQRRKAIDLSVEVIRHFVLDCVGLSPARQRAKVFVISEAERLSSAAQNAMLKTLEEPPGHSYLILIATSADEMLPTTRSRCHLVSFNALPVDFVEQTLIARTRTDPSAARFIAELTQGSLGVAMRHVEANLISVLPGLIDSLELARDDPLAAGKFWQDAAKSIAQTTGGKKKTAADDDEVDDDEPAAEDDDGVERSVGIETRTLREAQITLLSMLSTLLRDVQRIVVGHSPAAIPNDARLAALARGSAAREIAMAIRAIGKAEYELELNAYVPLVFDTLAIAISHALGGGVPAGRS